MMHIQFNPTLDETIHVSVSREDASVVLYFTATLSSDDHYTLTQDGAKVQLWSDIPLGTEWSESDFRDVNPFDAVEAGLEDSGVVSLCRSTAIGREALDLQKERTLSLKLPVPRVRDSQSCQYSFTYRLVSPSGEIKWLGRFGENGTIVIDLQNHPDVILGEEWTESNVGHQWNTGGRPADGLEVARLARPSDYVVWAMGNEAFFGATNAFLVFLVPRTDFPSTATSTNHVSLYAISATSDLTLAVSPSGAITASGVGSLTLCAYDARQLSAQAFINDVVSTCSPDSRDCVMLDEDNAHVILTPPKSVCGHPAKISIVPLHQSYGCHRVRIDHDALTAHFPSFDSYFLSSPLNSYIHFFTTQTHSGGHITFVVDPSGGEFTLSPAFDLAGEECQLSILTSYDSIRYSLQEEADMLPTPPPSPRLDPITRPSTSRESSISSIVPLSDIGEVLPRVKPESAQLVTLRPILVSLRALKFIFTAIAVWLVLLHGLVFRWLKLLGPMSCDGHPNNDSAISGSDKGANSMGLNNKYIEAGLPQNVAAPKVVEDGTRDINARPVGVPPAELLVETKGGLVKVVAHSVDATSLLERFAIEVNGKTEVASHTKLQDGVYLFELDAGGGGLMKLTYT